MLKYFSVSLSKATLQPRAQKEQVSPLYSGVIALFCLVKDRQNGPWSPGAPVSSCFRMMVPATARRQRGAPRPTAGSGRWWQTTPAAPPRLGSRESRGQT